ncbi:hypothetical protein [Aestuariicoccus sp. MJ-SS9]|uniref:hypothetical protein n=1 Tax=Aestuariicoccus sp. MJ-SS9 TaxID=3079855 RepID=UPI00290A5C62|nr:hypothetical protein [Aestuariicoccus sp. MJ-SS9]MDU8912171.1 hypothetical protein [Aestuariicoccus sp. MJ-SS9]
MRSFVKSCSFAAAAALFAASAAWAADPAQQHNSNAVWFENWVGLSNATMVVSSPNGKVTQIFAVSGTPVFELDRREAIDGVYRYELSAATEEKAQIINAMDNGRGEAARDTAAKPFYVTGHFVVERGAIVKPKEIKEEDG